MAQTQNRNQNNQDADKDLLLAIYGGKAFVKIYQALEIGKIKFSFVNKENTKEHIDCYIDADDFASDLIAIIDSDEIRKRAYAAKQEKEQTKSNYAKDIWESRVGVSQSDTSQLRKFTIQPGTSQDYAFRATQNRVSIVVGFAHRELKLLSYRWHFLEADWNKRMAEKYCLKNMTSEYHKKQNEEQYARQVAEENACITQEKPAENNASSNVPSSNNTSNANYSNQMSETPTYGISSNLKESRNPQNEEKQNAQKPEANNGNSLKIQSYTLKVKTPLCDINGGGKAFQGWGSDNNVYDVVIRKDVLEKANAELLKQASTLGAKLTVKGAITDKNRIYVAS